MPLEVPRFLPPLLTTLPMIIKRKPVMGLIPGLPLTAHADAAALPIEVPLPAVVLDLKVLTNSAVMSVEELPPAVVLPLKVLIDAVVLGIEWPLLAVVLALTALVDAAALKVEGEHGAIGHNHLTAPGTVAGLCQLNI